MPIIFVDLFIWTDQTVKKSVNRKAKRVGVILKTRNVKQLIFSVYIIFILCFFTSCTVYDTFDIRNSRDNDFMNQLRVFNAKQHSLVKGSMSRANGGLTDEDLEDIGNALDENTREFFLDNDEYLSQYAPELKLSEDEFEALLVDENAMIAYLHEILNPEVYSYVMEFTQGNLNVNLDSLASDCNLNPLELTEIICLSSYSDFSNYLIDNIHNIEEEDININDENTIINDGLTRRQKMDRCETDYMEDFRDCGILAIGATFTYMVSGSGALVMGAFSYGACQYSSYKRFKRCQRNVR